MVDVLDADLPVFPFRVNWKNGISERLEWKTDVLRDLAGNEQRRGLRLTPRREFEVTLTLWDSERSFLDLWLHRMLEQEFLFPVWHDSVRATQAAPQGQKTIWMDTTGLEFRIGSYGLLRGLTALQTERVQIAAIYANRIVTVDNLVADWPLGTRVEPLVRGRMTEETRSNLASSRASETQAVFQTTRENPYTTGVDSADQFRDLSVLTVQPNRREALDMQYLWTFSQSDSETGRRYRRSDEDRAMTQQKYSWFLRGRTAKSAFRSLLYRLKGALTPVWLPTFSVDLVLAQDADPEDTTIYVNEVGFAYTGGPTSGREFIVIDTRSQGRLYRRVTGTAVAPAGQERLVIEPALPDGLLRSDVRIISWIDTARLENDRVEFNHVNAADGMSTVSAVFRTFRNDRESIRGFKLENEGFYTGVQGWQGSIFARTFTGDGSPVYSGVYSAFAGANAVSEFWQDLFVPDLYRDLIDSGNAVLTGFAGWHQTYETQTDHGRLFVEFRDAGNNIITRADGVDDYALVWFRVVMPDLAIPVGTRIIRLGTHNTRDEGANNDNYWDEFTSPTIIENPL